MGFQLDKIFLSARNQGASDIHLKIGYKPSIRVHGKIHELDTLALDSETVSNIIKSILPESHQITFKENGNVDASLEQSLDGKPYRYRVNVAQDRHGPYVTMRLIPDKIINVRDIGFPFDVWKDIVNLQRGLVLVTGVTGSGKTTTLASLINEINMTRPDHIITIEDPVEYIYPKGKSMISQRELGVDVKSFGEGIKYVLRQDPDVVLVGEIRDKDTASKALEAAATGHLVFSTLHTKDAPDTVRRYVNIFDSEDHDNIRTSLASNLSYVLCQQLIPYEKGRSGRILAMEVMNIQSSPAIQNHLRKGEYHKVLSEMQIGRAHKMVTMDQRLRDLCLEEKISRQDAIAYAYNPEDLKKGFASEK